MHKQKRMSKVFYSESELDFSNFVINSASNFVSIFNESNLSPFDLPANQYLKYH